MTFMKIGIGKKRKSFQANSFKKVFSVGDFPGIDFICVSLSKFPEVEGMSLDRGVVSLKKEGEFQVWMRGNGKPSVVVDCLDDRFCILVWVDWLLQVKAKDVVISGNVANLKAGNDEQIVVLLCPMSNFLNLVEVGFNIFY